MRALLKQVTSLGTTPEGCQGMDCRPLAATKVRRLLISSSVPSSTTSTRLMKMVIAACSNRSHSLACA
jgi:hypothetical protein